MELSRGQLAALRSAMKRWYAAHQRTLPWRRTPVDPYHVLVSESMLQQTQVATVVDYFHRFINAFPSVQALAAASEQSVLRLWQGLGYYRRARHLHGAARRIVAEFDGRVPADVDQLMGLPGIGHYTAGAVASIAYGRRQAAVDGNVTRVLARLFAIDAPVDRPQTSAQLGEIAWRLIPPSDPGLFNQALMELGALICTARGPRCTQCPVANWCLALRRGVVDALPTRRPARRALPVTHHVTAICCQNRYLFVQRGARGLWARMWQMPTAEHLSGTAQVAQVRAWLRAQMGISTYLPACLGSFYHQTTHRSICCVCWRARLRGARPPGQWRTLDRLDDLPLANVQHRAVSLLAAHGA